MSDVLTVTELTRQLKDCLEGNFPAVAVRGEVSGATKAASGHLYFTLKDETAQLRVVMWKRSAQRLRFDVADGIELVGVGPIELYPPRGTYQLVAEELIPEGVGPLELAFRQLHDKLAAEGLFDADRKRPLPRFPRRIALVTSPTGAAVRDMLQVITRRWRTVDVVVVPVPVQGEGAAAAVAAGLRDAARLADVDLVVVGRGGGSLEDLWAFNEEVLARAIAASPLPVVSAVGHEIDVTIADLVADRRALTPSEAAELIVPDQREIHGQLDAAAARLGSMLRERAVMARKQLELLASRRVLTRPLERIRYGEAQLDDWQARLLRTISRRRERSAADLAEAAASLNALSPLKVLERGYSITQRTDGTVVRQGSDVQVGETLTTRLHGGQLTTRVESIDEPDSEITEETE